MDMANLGSADVAVLQAVKEHSLAKSTYVSPGDVAERIGLPEDEVLERLIALDADGYLMNANTHDGNAYRISDAGRRYLIRNADG